MSDIYEQHRKAFAAVSAYVIARKGDRYLGNNRLACSVAAAC